MNAVQTGIPTPEKLKVLARNSSPNKQKDLNATTDQTANQVRNVNKRIEANKAETAKKADETAKDPVAEKLEVNEYLKTVSRLENKLKQGEITDEDLEQITSSLEERILSLSDVQKNRLRNIEFFKKKGIDNINEMNKTFVEMFKDHNERDTIFEFLKSPEFMSILLNRQSMPLNYASIMNQNQMNSIDA